MVIETLKALYDRDLNRLKDEIISYQSEECIWHTDGTIANCAGNLCLHLVGNLKTYFGAVLGDTGYIRQRDLEFSQKDVTRSELLQMVDETLVIVTKVLDELTTEDLDTGYPQDIFGKPMSIGFFIIHLSTHLGYHLGQINYHRRLLDRESGSN